LHQDSRKSTSPIDDPTVTSNGSAATITLAASVKNALISLSPTIDYSFTMTLDVSGPDPTLVLNGTRDNFPAYEIYVNSEPIYQFAPHGAAGSTLPVNHYGPADLGGLFPILGNATIAPVNCTLYATISSTCR
jgi:hypothetical protein